MRQRQSSPVITALIVLVSVALGSMILAGMAAGFGPGGMMRGWYAGPYGMMSSAHGWLAIALGWLGMLAFVGAIVLAVVWAVRSLSSMDGRGAAAETPEEVLRRRFAAGEITREEYEQMRRVLGRHRRTGDEVTP
jgi:putative membrane protein